jgi:hypothetical protein
MLDRLLGQDTTSGSTYTPAATRAENAFEIKFPANKMAFRRVNSRRVYHFDKLSGQNLAANPMRPLSN